ncbi:MAG: CPBP family intramembrane metalloprotease [Holophagaceae bacterium]|nr:CPBP family intramembrane metalloprotease [Holophagaceae bacterium]
MEKIFFNQDHRLRNGWWILIFVLILAATRLGLGPAIRGLKHLGVGKAWLEPVLFLFVLGVTWACTLLRREPLASIGFRLDRRWLKELGWGTALGIGFMVAAAGMVWAVGGVRFELDPARSLKTLSYGAYMFLFVALFEETLFRGFLFQRLVAGSGVWVAQIALALLFAAGHWGNPGMAGATKVWATVDIALAAVFLGLAYLRTGSLALPVGLHLGWNWAQGHLLGFGVSGLATAGWVKPVFLGKAEWITGGAFGLEASVFGVVVDLLAIVLLWRWKGSVGSAGSAVQEPDAADLATEGA